MSVIQDNCSDAALRDVIHDDSASERKKTHAREILKRRRQSVREAWLARHGFAAALVAAFASLAAMVFRKKRQTG